MSHSPVLMDTPTFARYLNARVPAEMGRFDSRRARRWAESLGVLVWKGQKQRKRAYVDMRRLDVLGGPLARQMAEAA